MREIILYNLYRLKMELSTATPIFLNIGTILGLVIFSRKTSASIAKFKEGITNRLKVCEEHLEEQKECFDNHIIEDKKNKVSERLARIETDISWIRKALSKK